MTWQTAAIASRQGVFDQFFVDYEPAASVRGNSKSDSQE
jgi:hypothetical protein